MKSLKKYLFFCVLFNICTLASAQQMAASCILVYERGAKNMRADGNERIAQNFDNMRKAVYDVYSKEYGRAVLDKAVSNDRAYWATVADSEVLARMQYCNKDVLGLGK